MQKKRISWRAMVLNYFSCCQLSVDLVKTHPLKHIVFLAPTVRLNDSVTFYHQGSFNIITFLIKEFTGSTKAVPAYINSLLLMCLWKHAFMADEKPVAHFVVHGLHVSNIASNASRPNIIHLIELNFNIKITFLVISVPFNLVFDLINTSLARLQDFLILYNEWIRRKAIRLLWNNLLCTKPSYQSRRLYILWRTQCCS